MMLLFPQAVVTSAAVTITIAYAVFYDPFKLSTVPFGLIVNVIRYYNPVRRYFFCFCRF